MADSNNSNNLIARVMRISEFRQETPLDAFYVQDFHIENASDPVVKFVDDVYMLFNQQRLDKLSEAALLDMLNKSAQPYDELSVIRSKLTDKQLAQFVKSRYIQTRSELIAYAQYIDSNYMQLRDELDAQIAASAEPDVPAAPAAPASPAE